MEYKSNKELAIDVAIEFMKSWNSTSNTEVTKPNEFVDILNIFYDAICKLDER